MKDVINPADLGMIYKDTTNDEYVKGGLIFTQGNVQSWDDTSSSFTGFY